jgi:dihydroorotase
MLSKFMINENVENIDGYEVIDANNNYVLPGIIDTHVHFREPGLTSKADIYTESRAAAAGGVTSFIDMPNTIPPTIDIKTLNEKFKIAQNNSLINFSFYIAATNENYKFLKKIDICEVAGIKIFFGSSTGNLLVDNQKAIEKIFSLNTIPIVVHSEMDSIIKRNIEHLKKVGIELQAYHHPRIRSAEACIEATKVLLDLAVKYNSKLHILHISTKDEIDFISKLNIDRKRITFETSPNYLFFDSNDYETLGMKIKCNPAIKSPEDKMSLIKALNDNNIDTIALTTLHISKLKNKILTKKLLLVYLLFSTL